MLKQEILNRVRHKIECLCDEVVIDAGLQSGDIELFQKLELEKAEERIAEILTAWFIQNGGDSNG